MLSAYIKPTDYCPIDCEHCYLSEESRKDKRVMSDNDLILIATTLKSVMEKESHTGLHIIWHGGEPLTLSPEWYENAIDLLDSILGKGNYSQSIQTALLPYQSYWAPLIHKYFHSEMGSSIDFSQRKIKDSSEIYQKKWLRKVNQARKDGLNVIPCIVPTKNEINKAQEIIDFSIENEISCFNIERYNKNGSLQPLDWPSNSMHSRFLINLFDVILNRLLEDKKTPYVSVISAAINGVINSTPGERWGTTCQRDFLVFDAKGRINSCPDRMTTEKPFSNISNGVDSLLNSSQRRKWIRLQSFEHKNSYCSNCEFQSWCKSGCPVAPNDPMNEKDDCSGYKIFLDHVKESLKIKENQEKLLEYIS